MACGLSGANAGVVNNPSEKSLEITTERVKTRKANKLMSEAMKRGSVFHPIRITRIKMMNKMVFTVMNTIIALDISQ